MVLSCYIITVHNGSDLEHLTYIGDGPISFTGTICMSKGFTILTKSNRKH